MEQGRGVAAALSLALVLGISGCSQDDGAPPVAAPGPPGVSASPSASGSASPPTALPSPSASALASPSSTGSSNTPAEAPSPSPSASRSATGPAKVTQRRPRWALDRIDQRRLPLDRRFSTTGQGRGVTVYVVDGLFDVGNPELGRRASVGLASGRPCGLEDGVNHGLFVAGLVAGRHTGVAKQAKIVSVGASNGCEGGNGDETEAQATARLVRALDWVAQNARKPAVVNLSLNVDAPAPKVTAAVGRLTKAGLTVVASAGNEGGDACKHPPAGLPSVITVAASTKTDRDAGLNRGRCVDLFAPADGVTSVVDRGLSPSRLVAREGAATSWAAPLVSGTAALYLSAHPAASPKEVRAWVLGNATKGALRGNLHGSPNRLLYTGGPL